MLYFTGEALEDDESVSGVFFFPSDMKTEKTVGTLVKDGILQTDSFMGFISQTSQCFYIYFNSWFVLFFLQFEEEELEEGDEEVGNAE